MCGRGAIGVEIKALEVPVGGPTVHTHGASGALPMRSIGVPARSPNADRPRH